MRNENWTTCSGGKGHERSSSKVISKCKSDLTKHFVQVCVWNDWKVYLSGTWESDKWTLRFGQCWDWTPEVIEGH